MATHQIVIGPRDARRLIERGVTAGGIYRIQIEFQTVGDELNGPVTYFALDSSLNRMSDGAGPIRANGCPFPPNCGTISLALMAKNIPLTNENFAECAAWLKHESDILEIDK